MTVARINFGFINGLKQKPVDHDFHITPCLTFTHGKHEKRIGMILYNTVFGFALGLEWGYWALTMSVMFRRNNL